MAIGTRTTLTRTEADRLKANSNPENPVSRTRTQPAQRSSVTPAQAYQAATALPPAVRLPPGTTQPTHSSPSSSLEYTPYPDPPTYQAPATASAAFEEPAWLKDAKDWASSLSKDTSATTARAMEPETVEPEVSTTGVTDEMRNAATASSLRSLANTLTGATGRGSWNLGPFTFSGGEAEEGERGHPNYGQYRGDFSDESVLKWWNEYGRVQSEQPESWERYQTVPNDTVAQAEISATRDLLGYRDWSERELARTTDYYNNLKNENEAAWADALGKGEAAFQGIGEGIDGNIGKVEEMANKAWGDTRGAYDDVAAHTASITKQFEQTLAEIRKRTDDALQWLSDKENTTLSEFRNDTASMIEAAIPQARAAGQEQMQATMEGLARAGFAPDSPQAIASVIGVSSGTREKIGQLATTAWSEYNRGRADLRTKYAELGSSLRSAMAGTLGSVASSGLAAMGQAGYNLATMGRALSDTGTTLTATMGDVYKWGADAKSALAANYATFQTGMEELRLRGNDQVADAFKMMASADMFIPETDFTMYSHQVEIELEDRAWAKFMDVMGLLFQGVETLRSVFGRGGCSGGGGGGGSSGVGGAAVSGGMDIAKELITFGLSG